MNEREQEANGETGLEQRVADRERFMRLVVVAVWIGVMGTIVLLALAAWAISPEANVDQLEARQGLAATGLGEA